MFDAFRAEVFIEMNDGFGIRLGAQPVAATEKVLAQVAVVIDLAVKSDPDGAVLIRDRLVAAGKVNNAQATVSETHRPIHVEAFIVGTTVSQGPGSRLERRARYRSAGAEIVNSANATHKKDA